MDHLHFFLGVVVLKEDVDVRDAVERDTVGIHVHFGLFQIEHLADLRFQFADALLPGAGNGLIGGDHHAADACGVVQGLQGHDHLDGGAVRVGDDAVVPFQRFGVHFGHDQRATLVHAPRAGVVHDDAARGGGVGGVLFGGGAARGEDGDVDAFEHIFLQFAHDQLGIPVGDFGPGGTGRGEGNDLSGGEVPAFKGLQHFTADGAGSSHNSDNEFFFRHGILYPRTKKESLGACDFRKAFDVHLTGCRRCQVRWSAFHPKSVSFFDSISGIHV